MAFKGPANLSNRRIRNAAISCTDGCRIETLRNDIHGERFISVGQATCWTLRLEAIVEIILHVCATVLVGSVATFWRQQGQNTGFNHSFRLFAIKEGIYRALVCTVAFT